MRQQQALVFGLFLCAFFSFWFVAVVARSFLFLGRINAEIRHPQTAFFPEIVPCSVQIDQLTREQLQLLRYRSLGVSCKTGD